MTASHAAVPPVWAQRQGVAGLLPFVLRAMATWVALPCIASASARASCVAGVDRLHAFESIF